MSVYKDGAAEHAFVVTPSDTTVFPFATIRVFCGTTGNLTVRMIGGEVVTFTGVLAGANLAISVDKILATGTTVTNMVAQW